MSSWSYGQQVVKNLTRTVNTGSQLTAAFSVGVEYIRVTSSATEVFIDIAKSPTATVANGIRLVANEPKTLKIDNADKLAAIIASGTASVFIEELSE